MSHLKVRPTKREPPISGGWHTGRGNDHPQEEKADPSPPSPANSVGAGFGVTAAAMAGRGAYGVPWELQGVKPNLACERVEPVLSLLSAWKGATHPAPCAVPSASDQSTHGLSAIGDRVPGIKPVPSSGPAGATNGRNGGPRKSRCLGEKPAFGTTTWRLVRCQTRSSAGSSSRWSDSMRVRTRSKASSTVSANCNSLYSFSSMVPELTM